MRPGQPPTVRIQFDHGNMDNDSTKMGVFGLH